MTESQSQSALIQGLRFVRAKFWIILLISAVLLIPCFWHQRIEAGDLGSHVYNAWLAQLIEKGQAPGLYFAKQWNNVLFDIALLHAANLFGFAAADFVRFRNPAAECDSANRCEHARCGRAEGDSAGLWRF